MIENTRFNEILEEELDKQLILVDITGRCINPTFVKKDIITIVNYSMLKWSEEKEKHGKD